MKKKLILLIGAIVVFIFAVVALGLGLGKESGGQDVEGDFVDNQVLIVLTREETLKFLDYTVEDFADVGAIAVEELGADVTDWVRKKVLGIPTDNEMLVNIDKYCRIFSITLDKHSKANVIKMSKKLEQRDGIQSAEPNYIFSIA